MYFVSQREENFLFTTILTDFSFRLSFSFAVKNVYSIFQFSPPAIGFATLANPAQLLNGIIPTSNATSIADGGNSTLINTQGQLYPPFIL